MNPDVLNTLLLAGLFLALFGLAEFGYHFLKVKVELSRKFVHLGTGLLTLLFPIMLTSHWFVLMLCSSFALLLIFSLKFNLLPSINAIERESVGSIAYPVSVYVCFIAFDYAHQNYLFFYLPILILAICDPLAALTGKKWPKGRYKIGRDNKTLMGSSLFFLMALLLSYALFVQFNTNSLHLLIYSLLIALVTAVAEAVSGKGYDNITIPVSALLVLFLVL